MIDPCRKCIVKATCKDECGSREDHDKQWMFIKAIVFFSFWNYFAYAMAKAFVVPI